MPNYNINEIKLTGLVEDIKRFLEFYINPDTKEFDFNRIIPEPQKIEDCPFNCMVNENSHIEEYPDRPWFNWYEWHYRFWGTKWNAWGTRFDDINKTSLDIDDNNEVEYVVSFVTAWCPPMPILKKICKDWYSILDISCFYIEEDSGFCGVYDLINGNCRYEGGCDSLEFRECTIDWGYYSQEYWDDYDAENELNDEE